MSATILSFPKPSQRRPGHMTHADRQGLLEVAYGLRGYSLDFDQDDQGETFAMVTPDDPDQPLSPFVVGWTRDGRVIVTDCTTGAEGVAETVAEGAALLRRMVDLEGA